MTRRLVLAFAVLTAACGSAPDPAIETPPDAPPPVPPSLTTRLAPGVSVEVLMAGKPPHRSLSYGGPLDGEPEHSPLFLGSSHYGPPGDERTSVHASLGVRTRGTEAGDVMRRTFTVTEGDTLQAEVALMLGARGPSDVALDYSDSLPVDAVLDALVIPYPNGPVGEGAVWRVDRPIEGSDVPANAVLRTTVELAETFSDGVQLKLETTLHIPGAKPLTPGEAKQNVQPAQAAANPAERTLTATAQVWRHFGRTLPARAYGQFRQTRHDGDVVYTDIVDWSLELSAGAQPQPALQP